MKRRAIRTRLREAFMNKYPELCLQAFTLPDKRIYPHWKTEKGRELCQKIRKEIGYSTGTDNGQIFWTTYRQWKDLQNLKKVICQKENTTSL